MEENELRDEFLIDAIADGAMWALECLHDRYSQRREKAGERRTGRQVIALK